MLDIHQIISLAPVIPVLTITRMEDAVPLGRALTHGGLRVLEVTLRTPAALPAIVEMRAALKDAVIGAGTLTRASDFEAAQKAGAQFGVSPGSSAEILAAARAVDYPLLPGVMTPSEVLTLRSAGYTAMKLFPAQQAGGVDMLRALHAPIPDVFFCPTGGVTRASAPSFLALPNVRCVGGSWLAPPALIDAKDWNGIAALASDAASLGKF